MELYLTNGHWVVSTQIEFPFVKLCQKGQNTVSSEFTVRPPIQIVALEESCSAVTSALTLPPHYHQETKYDMTNLLETFMASYNVSSVELWRPIHSKIFNLSAITIPNKLQDLETILMDRLVNELASVDPIDPSFDFGNWPNWSYAVLGLSISLLIGIIIFVYCYCKCRGRWSGKLWQRNKKPNRGEENSPLVTVKTYSGDNAGRDNKTSAPVPPVYYSKEKNAVETMTRLYPSDGNVTDTITQLYPTIRMDAADRENQV
jgi:hypothetical protein